MEQIRPYEVAREAFNVAQNIVDFGVSRMSIRAWSEMPRPDQPANIIYYEGEK